MLLEFTPGTFLAGIGMLLVALFLLYRRKRSPAYLFFFTVFWLYLLGVMKMAIFPIHIPLPGQIDPTPFAPSMNLIPLYFRCWPVSICVREILGNILLTMPFGFGIRFIARLKARDFLWLAPVVGLAIEGIQLVLSLALRSAFRAVDINDVLLNALGVGLGYGLFRIFSWVYHALAVYLKKDPNGLRSYLQDGFRSEHS